MRVERERLVSLRNLSAKRYKQAARQIQLDTKYLHGRKETIQVTLCSVATPVNKEARVSALRPPTSALTKHVPVTPQKSGYWKLRPNRPTDLPLPVFPCLALIEQANGGTPCNRGSNEKRGRHGWIDLLGFVWASLLKCQLLATPLSSGV